MDDERRRRLMERVTIGALVLLVAVVVVDQVIDGGGAPAPPPDDDVGASAPDGRTADGSADAPRSDTVAAEATVAETAARAARTESVAAAAPETADRSPEEQLQDRTPEEPTREVTEAPARTAEPRTAEAGDTPELLDLRVGSRVVTVPAGSEGVVRVAVGKDGRPRAGVPIVLEGSEALPGVGRRLEAVTDSAGTAVFRFAVGAVPDTVPLRILARGYWLRGDNRVTLRVVP